MKTMIILLMLFLFGNAHAQKVTQLGEVRIINSPEMKFSSNLDKLEVKIKENYAGQFSQDPIKFLKENFKIEDLIGSLEPGTYDQYDVTFKSRKGYLLASFDKNGELVRTYQKFKNIALPNELSKELYQNYKGYSITKNKYIASGMGYTINRHHYILTMQNGNDKQKVKLTPAIVASGKVAVNY